MTNCMYNVQVDGTLNMMSTEGWVTIAGRVSFSQVIPVTQRKK